MLKAGKRQSNYYNKRRRVDNFFEQGDLVYKPNKTLSSVLINQSPVVVIIGDDNGKEIGKYYVSDFKAAWRSNRLRKTV